MPAKIGKHGNNGGLIKIYSNLKMQKIYIVNMISVSCKKF